MMSLWRSFSRLNIYIKNLNINSTRHGKTTIGRMTVSNYSLRSLNKNAFHTSCTRRDLLEFFDNKKNWTEFEVRVGRSWKKEELRIKSNSDLHKLWYILLKEKNMLLTMEHEYHRQGRGLPNPERIDKVDESMENLEAVVRERNRAYFELETGETGERPEGLSTNCFGLEYKYKMREYFLEKRFNKKFLEDNKLFNHTTDHVYVKDFLKKLEEKKRRQLLRKRRAQHHAACQLLKIFPNLDEEALKEQFPNLDIEKVKKDKKARSHQENAY